MAYRATASVSRLAEVLVSRAVGAAKVWLACGSALVVVATFLAVRPVPVAVDGSRTTLTRAELMGEPSEPALVDNGWFLPSGDSGSAIHDLAGTLTVPRAEMQLGVAGFRSYRFFPGFSADFFTHDGYLVPADRSLITTPGNWSLLLSPGRVWSEPGDDGMSRASFPFALGSPPDRPYTGGEVHNGVATFLYDDDQVSSFRFQITQETAPDGDIFDMWAQLPLTYEPTAAERLATSRADFGAELAAQVPIRPWADLEDRVGRDVLDSFTDGLAAEEISAAGVVVDDTIYLQPSHTRHGDYPYPRYMHHAGMSVSKSIGAGIAMLWLAEEFGPEVFDLRIVDHLDVAADHDGWTDVTFGDVLNMATGIGDNAPDRRPFDVYADETGPNFVRFYLAATADEKLAAAFAAGNHPWGPGELLRYTSAQTFVLAAAIDSFLASREGLDGHLWERLNEEVFHPIGVDHLSMMHVSTASNGGVPLMSSGLRLTVDDLAKIVTLLQNDGVHDGEQLLHRASVRDALYRTGRLAGLPSGKSFDDGDQAYHASFWSLPHRSDNGTYFQVPFMSGAGGITVFLAPNGVTTFVFTDAGRDGYSLNSPAVAEAIRPYPDDGLDGVTLVPDDATGGGTTILVAALVAIAAALGLATYAWRRRLLHKPSDDAP